MIRGLAGFELADTAALGLLLVPVVLALLAYRWRRRRAVVLLPTAALLGRARPSLRARFGWLPTVLRLAALVLLVVVIARPRLGESHRRALTHGVDMVVALDVSGSMRAEDFRPNNRLHVARELVDRFIASREHDRLGLVVFAGKALTRCPLTLDYTLLRELVADVGFDDVPDEGTALGQAIAVSVNRLRRSEARSRVVIVVTDGDNNRGAVDPLTAAEAARTLGIRIYGVGVGRGGRVPFPTEDGYREVEVPFDEAVLEQLATHTGGFYFRATDTASFAAALERIGELETSEIETTEYHTYRELFVPMLYAVLVLLTVEITLGGSVLRRLP